MTALPPRPPAAPPRRPPVRFTLDQYFELDRLGYFNAKRVELVHGELIEMSPVNFRHALAVGLVSDALSRAFATGHHVVVQQPLLVPDTPLANAPQPDVMAVSGARRDYTDHPTCAALLVEVSDTTLDHDLTTKAELYATAGVPEYWVLDVNARELHVFRDPQPLPATLGATAYQVHTAHAVTECVTPLCAPHASIAVADLVP
jgi:Uma2 family endonuclease